LETFDKESSRNARVFEDALSKELKFLVTVEGIKNWPHGDLNGTKLDGKKLLGQAVQDVHCWFAKEMSMLITGTCYIQ
jgi:hypothetical protein